MNYLTTFPTSQFTKTIARKSTTNGFGKVKRMVVNAMASST